MQQTTRFYYDTEFVEDGVTIDLISIGIVCDKDGREFYAVSNEFDQQAARTHPFVGKEVWPQLPLRLDSDEPENLARATLNLDDPVVRPRAEIRDAVFRFLTSGEGAPRLWASCGAYDHVALSQLWGTMAELPTPPLPHWTSELKDLEEQLGSPELPEQESGRHHALYDARQDRVVHQHLLKLVGQMLRPRAAASP